MAIKYYVNENKGTVVAVLCDTKYDAVASIEKITEFVVEFEVCDIKEDMLIQDKYIGKAKCDSRDTFSLEVGKSIAKKKCMDKYYKAKDKAVKNFYLRAKNNLDKLGNYIYNK